MLVNWWHLTCGRLLLCWKAIVFFKRFCVDILPERWDNCGNSLLKCQFIIRLLAEVVHRLLMWKYETQTDNNFTTHIFCVRYFFTPKQTVHISSWLHPTPFPHILFHNLGTFIVGRGLQSPAYTTPLPVWPSRDCLQLVIVFNFVVVKLLFEVFGRETWGTEGYRQLGRCRDA
jgi:hypothetical protein